jgi:hypothetical protein
VRRPIRPRAKIEIIRGPREPAVLPAPITPIYLGAPRPPRYTYLSFPFPASCPAWSSPPPSPFLHDAVPPASPSPSFFSLVPPPYVAADVAADTADRRPALDLELFAQGARYVPQNNEQDVRSQAARIAGKRPLCRGRQTAGRPRRSSPLERPFGSRHASSV